MQKPLFVDSSTIIIGITQPETNSARVLGLIGGGKAEAIISEKALLEVKRFFLAKRGEKFAYATERFLKKNFRVVPRAEVEREIAKYRGQIKEKDLEHLATAKKFGATIVAFDRDFEPFKEYVTPKQFVKTLKMKQFETEY
ncbi:PIN domain-containing protein [Candidatus Micrarchaeota archaeon]|nr:PIN domain-containing protein [Candidatus Micrarchaeota archaeon]